ncbi:hypothetical protein IW261DRAFT_1570197 [Armillaria novae-zelandiae]|uniref:Uncharacterized protein n=1 Tax=Armillaria novae-zelandiae TaxID=153914 RepID=A0AA39UBX6_9AGAR|nr:hypothetical protein IW261DRAFT_1570197 [Armillaria novae-zelandiae]
MSTSFRSSKLRAPLLTRPLSANGHQVGRVRNLPAHGDIYVVEESLIHPYQQLCTTALQAKAKYRGKRRPGVACSAPNIHGFEPPGKSTHRPCFFFMGTFDGSDENALPSVLKDYAVLVSTGKVSVPENPDVFHIHTSPEWQTSGASHHRWMRRNSDTSEETEYSVPPDELLKLVEYSRHKLKEFTTGVLYDTAYLKTLAEQLNACTKGSSSSRHSTNHTRKTVRSTRPSVALSVKPTMKSVLARRFAFKERTPSLDELHLRARAILSC